MCEFPPTHENSPSLSSMVTAASPSSPIVTLLGSDDEFMMRLKVLVISKMSSSIMEILKSASVIPEGKKIKYGPLK